MSSTVEEHVIYQISNAPIREYPYPHIYVEQVFPSDFYAQLRINWPDSSSLVTIADAGLVVKGAYAERFVLPLNDEGLGKLSEDQRAFWSEFASWFTAPRFLTSITNKFDRYITQRFGDERYRYDFHVNSLVVRDHTNYKIGPHTDAPYRLLSLLFYCPDDDRMKHLGTSIYVPRDPDFRCKGDTHYPHARFQKITTMEYKPNTLFAFFKTDNSFHGVDPITDLGVQRDVLLYDVHISGPADHRATKSPGLGIKMLRRLFTSQNQGSAAEKKS